MSLSWTEGGVFWVFHCAKATLVASKPRASTKNKSNMVVEYERFIPKPLVFFLTLQKIVRSLL